MIATLEERFWAKVARGGERECWRWTAAISPQGYGVFRAEGATVGAHRMAVELTRGPIPASRQVHHTCRRRDCVNPSHLLVVTPKEHQRLEPLHQGGHNRAKTHCPQGHRYSLGNTRWVGRRRFCKTCQRDYMRRRREALRAA